MESSSLLDISTLQTDSTLGDGSLLTLVDDGDAGDNTNGFKEEFEVLLDVPSNYLFDHMGLLYFSINFDNQYIYIFKITLYPITLILL